MPSAAVVIGALRVKSSSALQKGTLSRGVYMYINLLKLSPLVITAENTMVYLYALKLPSDRKTSQNLNLM